MLITALESISKTKTRVTIDDDETLVLSNKECYAYDLREGQELAPEVYDEIMATLRAGALQRAGNILKGMDYTEQGLRDKLIRAGYPSGIAAEVVGRLAEAHYLDDRRYAESYVRYHIQDRSLARIRDDLRQKGIAKEFLSEVLAAYEEEHADTAAAAEEAQIRKALVKRHYDPETATYEERMKAMAALARKGYSTARIRKVMGDNSDIN